MSFGCRVWGPTGALELDENSFTVRIIHTEIVVAGTPAPGRTRVISLPGVHPNTHSAICVPIAPYDPQNHNQSSIAYTPIVTPDGVTIFYGAPNVNTGPIGVSPQRLIVMRYR